MSIRLMLAGMMPLVLVYALGFTQAEPPYAAVVDKTSLHELARIGDITTMQELLADGANANGRLAGAISPLHIAAYYDHSEMAGLLVKYGGNVHARRDKWSWTPLHVAVQREAVATVEVLIESGADINSRDMDGWTPLHVAAEQGHFETVKLLLEHGASINARDDAGNAPLHLAVENGYIETAVLLVDNGADVNAQNDDEQTPLYVADICDQQSAICLLRIHGAVK